MTRQRFDLCEGDVVVLARAIGTDPDSLLVELERRPSSISDLLRRPEVVESVMSGTGPEHLAVSPLLFFAVLVHHSAEELAGSEWVADWIGPGCRLPVFDVEPLLEFADAPARLLFTSRLLAGFAAPSHSAVTISSTGSPLSSRLTASLSCAGWVTSPCSRQACSPTDPAPAPCRRPRPNISDGRSR
jgi:hypothetical protein